MRYRLELFSNFTYALERPDTGDQFAQKDSRSVYGLQASHAFGHTLAGLPLRTEVGVQVRHDRIRGSACSTPRERQTVATTREDEVRQTMLGLYGQSAVEISPSLRAVLGLRADRLTTRVDALTLADNGGRASATQLSPKLSLIAGPFAKTEFFFNAGRGLHSNDARGTTARVDPKSGDAVDPVPPLVAARGIEDRRAHRSAGRACKARWRCGS